MDEQLPQNSFLSSNPAERNKQGNARRLQDLINCLDSKINRANDVLCELLKQRSTLLAEANYMPGDKDNIPHDVRRFDSELPNKQAEISNAQAKLLRLQQCSDLYACQLNNSAPLDPKFSSPFPLSRPHDHKDEVKLCRALIDQLMQDYSLVRQQLEHSRKLFSPILRLPLKLLQYIFLFCLPSQRFIPLHQQLAPLLLTGVCRLFREHALATPTLWASLTIHRNKSGTGFYPHPNLIQLFIVRSAAVPLSWSLEDAKPILTPVDTNRPPMPVSQIVDLYVPHAQRWKHVCIDYGSGWVPMTGLDSLPANSQFPLLETLSIKRGYWLDNCEIRILSQMLNSPVLYGISWYSQKPYTTLTMPWSQLRQFSINHLVPVNEALNIISLCYKLKEVEMNILLPTKINDDSSIEIFVHDSLQAFKVEVAGDPNILFGLISFPGLNCLEITLSHGPRLSPMSLPLLREFIDRSSCILEKFAIKEAQLNPDELLDFLIFLSPSLIDLSFQHERNNAAYITENILHMMTHPDIHGPRRVQVPSLHTRFSGALCPKLKYLRLWGVVGSSDGVLADMLESRWIGCRKCQPGQVLDAVFVILDDDMDQNRHQEDFRRMQDLNTQRLGLCFQRLVRVVMEEQTL